MVIRNKNLWVGVITLCVSALAISSLQASEGLSHWSSGEARAHIVEFVANISDPDSANYVPVNARLAVFDNDGTLWGEDPWPVPFEFLLHRIRSLEPANPDWRHTYPYRAVLEDDREWLRKNLRKAIGQLSASAQANLDVEEYDRLVAEFLANVRHPETGMRYTQMVYAPMLQLVQFLQDAGFTVYIVSGGDIDFIRAYSEEVYGVPRANIIGSRMRYKLLGSGEEMRIVRTAKRDVVNLGRNKALNIHIAAGRRPIVAIGNSIGDLQMLQFSAAGPQRSLQIVLVHDDAEREFATLAGAEKLIAVATASDWLTVSMKSDFLKMYVRADDALH
jgi:phosphoserine phosphatase